MLVAEIAGCRHQLRGGQQVRRHGRNQRPGPEAREIADGAPRHLDQEHRQATEDQRQLREGTEAEGHEHAVVRSAFQGEWIEVPDAEGKFAWKQKE